MSDDGKCCTYEKTSNVAALQYHRNCVTCFGESDEDQGACLSCIAQCHSGHNLGPLKVASVYCLCGKSGSCKSLADFASKKRVRDSHDESTLFEYNDDDESSHCSDCSHRSYINHTNYEDDEDLVIFAPHKYDSDSDCERKKPQKRSASNQFLQKNTSDASLAPSSTIINIRRAIALLESKNNASKAAAAAATAASNAAAAVESAAKKSNGKPSKKEKDPNAPRGAMASYMMFSNETRGLMRDQTHGMTMVEVSRLIATRWKAMGPAEKQPYEEMAREDRDRYLVEMHEYKLRKGL